MKPSSPIFAPVVLSLLGVLPSLAAADLQDEHPILLLSKDEDFHFELLGPLGLAISGGSDIGPMLQAAKNITPGDMDSYGEVFYQLANETKAMAEDQANAYDPVNVRDAWFSASQYFRRADSYLHGNWDDPLINTLWDEQLAAFDKGLAALPYTAKRLRVAADNFTVEAIWYSAAEHEQRPTLIIGGGYESAQEDMYHVLAAGALERGWNALTYEGPGHPLPRRKQNLGFIYDWERVVTPLVDYLLTEKKASIDPNKLVLYGNSYGGYQAARAAAFEPRLSAVMLNGGVWDTFESFSAHLPEGFSEMFEAGNKEEFDEKLLAMANSDDAPLTLRWGVSHGLWAFKTKSPYEFLKSLKSHTIKDIVQNISQPVWIADAELEDFFTGQSRKVKDALGDQAELRIFTGSAGYHCQNGAYQEMMRVIFAWLHKTLGGSEPNKEY